ncbi:MAG: acyl-[acyl-carrier-protein] thioesterase [Lachnospiraceae bacterium]|nr:acyl-[acyl-carrier-protein] thioesterase [Lachnospiraceae bacterium]
MYSFKSKVRYSETDRDGKLTLEAMIDYFQDCSTFQSEELGLGIPYLKEHHMVWVLSAWQIVIEASPKLCDEIEIGTLPYGFKGFLGYRNFFLKDSEGNFLARANSIWTLLNTDDMRPARPTEEMKEGYVPEEKLPMEYAPRKIELPEHGKKQEEILVKPHHIDSNNHVNNGQYVRIAMEYLPAGFEIRELRAEYKKQAVLHDVIITIVYEKEDGYVIALCDSEEQPYAVVEFTGGRNT